MKEPRPRLYETVRFTNLDCRPVLMEPWPRVFLVTREFFGTNTVEVRRLTVRSLAGALARNYGAAIWRRFLKALCWVGFLDVPEGDYPSFRKDWRWAFWRTRARRAKMAAEVRARVEQFKALFKLLG